MDLAIRKILYFFILLFTLFVLWFMIFDRKISTKTVSTLLNSTPVPTQLNRCPPGFILVSDFCVMKYDAKCTNTNLECVTREGVYKNNTPGCECQGKYQIVSKADGAPVTYLPEDDGTDTGAKVYCQNIGAHLITNSEWMIIARDVEKVSANWCNRDGTGCGNPPGTPGKILANGHNDAVPGKALTSGTDDQSCYGTTTDGVCGSKSSQKRTLTLSSGEVIWDFAGNVWQWIDVQVSRKDEPRTKIAGFGNVRWTWTEFPDMPYDASYMPADPNLNSKNGVGKIFHFNSLIDKDLTIYTFIRGGNWRHGNDSGVFTVHMQPVPAKTNIDDIGFRCVTHT